MNKPTRPFLLVEDDEGDVFIMKRVLKRAGIGNPLHVVTDGNMAIDYFSGTGEFSDRTKCPIPALVFLDLKLPFKGGFEVLKWIRSKAAFDRVLVVVLTSSSEERDKEDALRLGAHSFLVKPPTVELIQDLLQAFESHWEKFDLGQAPCGGGPG